MAKQQITPQSGSLENNPLAELKDIHLPMQPNWWPPAPGWWVLAILVITGLLWLIWMAWQKRQKNRLRKQAIERLQKISVIHHTGDKTQLVASLWLIVKTLASKEFGYTKTGGLHGQAWLHFLEQTSNQPGAFTCDAMQHAVSGHYTGSCVVDVALLKDKLISWCRTYKVVLPNTSLRETIES